MLVSRYFYRGHIKKFRYALAQIAAGVPREKFFDEPVIAALGPWIKTPFGFRPRTTDYRVLRAVVK